MFRLLIAAGIALTPGIALAQSAAPVSENGALAGRSPTKLYRPVAQQLNCNPVQPHRQTGKIPLAPVVSADRACAMQVAERASDQRKD